MLNSLGRLILDVSPHADVHLMPFLPGRIDVDDSIIQHPERCGTLAYNRYSQYLSPLLLPIGRRLVKPLVMPFLRRDLPQLSTYLEQFDLIINAPQGPSIGDLYDLTADTIFPLAAARSLALPYSILGVSMGPFESPYSRSEEVIGVLSDAREIVLREAVSARHLLGLLGERPGHHLATDIVFATPHRLTEKPAKILEVWEATSKRLAMMRPALGACISLTAARNPRRPFDLRRYMAKMKAFLTEVLRETGRPIILFPHLKRDSSRLLEITGALPSGSDVMVFPESLDSDFQQEAIACLDFFIAARFHPTVFSIKQRIPFLPIINQFKAEGILDHLQIRIPRCFQDDDLETWISRFRDAWRNRDEIRSQTALAASRASMLAGAYRPAIARLLGGS